MNYWLMAMSWGSQGSPLWRDCIERGIAAIGYWWDYSGLQPVEDCSKLKEAEYDDIWSKRRPKSISPRNSLKHVVYHMKEGDIIYARGRLKKSPFIVGKGKIIKGYQYDPNVLGEIRFTINDWKLVRRNEYTPDIFEEAKHIWGHFVTVKWEKDFQPFKLSFKGTLKGTQLITVLKLNDERLSEIVNMKNSEKSLAFRIAKAVEAEKLEAIEGIKKYRYEAVFRSRNCKLIEEKKRCSDYRCEVCKMRFVDVYGKIGEKYIIAHHIRPIGQRESGQVTRIDDIALVCSNCHDMLHREDPPMSIDDLYLKMTKKE
ncbi:MAG: hypothetical protein A2Y62_12375 [Candidatus Fischerbacteria bacterium RBG_13_37_8]|uniref:HNH domain-containing protein n=1 Tax=Candidatus Fischerbacteria bacterium RBG_13_37_8 TaxID=1817863 RepID=A0A1F5VSM2_9BACT|nr:MAG: hypothetical protein A2Y62_12375 [Candidatus Fischerbacteria bacterium RBG_13_37_8]